MSDNSDSNSKVSKKRKPKTQPLQNSNFQSKSKFSALEDSGSISSEKFDQTMNSVPAPQHNRKSSPPRSIDTQRNFDKKVLSKLNLNNLNFQQSGSKPLLKLAEEIDNVIRKDFDLYALNFGDSSFSLTNADFLGPLWSLNRETVNKIDQYLKDFDFDVLRENVEVVAQDLIEQQNTAHSGVSSRHMNSTFGHQILIQLISQIFDGLIYYKTNEENSLIEKLAQKYEKSIGKEAVGHTLLWIAKQSQTRGNNKIFLHHPGGITFWFKHFFPIHSSEFSSKAHSKTVLMNSLEFIQLLLKDYRILYQIKNNVQPEISSRNLFTLLKLKSAIGNREISKNDKVLSEVYDTVKQMVFVEKRIKVNFSSSDFCAVIDTLKKKEDYIEKENEILKLLTEFLLLNHTNFEKNFYSDWLTSVKNDPEENCSLFKSILTEANKNTPKWKKFLNKKEFNYFLNDAVATCERTGETSHSKVEAEVRKLQKKIAKASPMLSKFIIFVFKSIFVYFVYLCIKESCSYPTECGSNKVCGFSNTSEPVGCLYNHSHYLILKNYYTEKVLPEVEKISKNFNKNQLPKIKNYVERIDSKNFELKIKFEDFKKNNPNLLKNFQNIFNFTTTNLNFFDKFLQSAAKVFTTIYLPVIIREFKELWIFLQHAINEKFIKTNLGQGLYGVYNIWVDGLLTLKCYIPYFRSNKEYCEQVFLKVGEFWKAYTK